MLSPFWTGRCWKGSCICGVLYQCTVLSSCPQFHVLGKSACVVHADLRSFFVNVYGGQAQFLALGFPVSRLDHFRTRQLELKLKLGTTNSLRAADVPP
jgi:hypothetical protein